MTHFTRCCVSFGPRQVRPLLAAFGGLVLGSVCNSSAATPLEIAQQAYLKASNPGVGDRFGSAVAISGDTVVVGAPQEDSLASGVNGAGSDPHDEFDAGAAYVFVRRGTNWTQEAYLKASNPGGGDQFGRSVSISGDTIVIGAPDEDSGAIGVNGEQNNNNAAYSGAAYVFVRQGTNWSQQAYLKASNTRQGGYFGYSVGVSGDTIVVGAYGEASTSSGVNGDQSNQSLQYSGAAYVFVRRGTNWSQQAYLKGNDVDARLPGIFGAAVAVSGDTVAVGAQLSFGGMLEGNPGLVPECGDAYVFVRHETNWTQQALLRASHPGPGDRFGAGLALSGDTLVVGAIAEDSGATGVNGDANDNSVKDSGAAYIFARHGTNWAQEAYLKPADPGPVPDQIFGLSAAISGDTVLVGPGSEVAVYVRSGTNWLQQHGTNVSPAYTWAVGIAGGTTVVGAPLESSSAIGVNGDPSLCCSEQSGAAFILMGIGTSEPPDSDVDDDGVPDSRDLCPNTTPGSIIDADGCSVEQLVPCEGPWRNHGDYISTLSAETLRFVKAGLLTEAQRSALLQGAAVTDCGKR